MQAKCTIHTTNVQVVNTICISVGILLIGFPQKENNLDIMFIFNSGMHLTHELFICASVWLGSNHIIAECLHFNMKKHIKSYLSISNI